MEDVTALLQDIATRHAELLWALAVGSLVMLLASLVAVPWLLLRMPADYYAGTRSAPRFGMLPASVRLPLLALKNALGVLLLLAGIAMLVLPGQGLLTCLLALALLDLPGKRRVERWLLRRPPVLSSINWLRRRGGRPELRIDADCRAS